MHPQKNNRKQALIGLSKVNQEKDITFYITVFIKIINI